MRRLFHELAQSKPKKAIFLVAERHGLRACDVGLLGTGDLDFAKLRITASPHEDAALFGPTTAL